MGYGRILQKRQDICAEPEEQRLSPQPNERLGEENSGRGQHECLRAPLVFNIINKRETEEEGDRGTDPPRIKGKKFGLPQKT